MSTDISAILDGYGWKFWTVCSSCSAIRKEYWLSPQLHGYILMLIPSRSNWSLKDKKGRTLKKNHYSRFEQEMKQFYENIKKTGK